MNRRRNWEILLKYANEELGKDGYKIVVLKNNDESFIVGYEHSGDTQVYADYYYEDELSGCVNDVLSYLKEELARQKENKREFFTITSVSRDDLDAAGFDASDVDDSTMEYLASKMANDYLEQLYWSSLRTIAECMDIPLKEE